MLSHGSVGSLLTALCVTATLGCGSGEETAAGFVNRGPGPSDGAPSESDYDASPYPSGWDGAPIDTFEPDSPDRGPPYPIVLHHGFSGWEKANVLGIEYFYGVVDELRAHGEAHVFVTTVDPYNATDVRAEQLAQQITSILRQSGKDKVNVVAHSQGGLDSRYVISTLGYGDRIASLTTISTPHRGTRLAEAVLKWVPDWTDPLLNAIADVIGRELLDVESDSDLRASLESLSEHHVRNVFNPLNVDDPRVAYYSYAGRSNDADGVPECDGSVYPNDPGRTDHIDPLLALTGAYLKKAGEGVHCPNDECANDGIVTVQSSRWGLFFGCVPADHFDEIGQVMKQGPNEESGYYHLEFYRSVVQRLRELGY